LNGQKNSNCQCIYIVEIVRKKFWKYWNKIEINLVQV